MTASGEDRLYRQIIRKTSQNFGLAVIDAAGK
jgi:hypothetical protein